MTTMTLSGRLMRPVATPPARRATLIGFGATLLGGLLIIAGVSVAIGMAAAETILPGVTVGDVELSGLSPAAAAERLDAELPSLATGKAIVVVGDEEATVAYRELGRGYETQAMVDAAFGIGRKGNPLVDGLDRLRSVVRPAALPVIVHAYDTDALDRVSAEIADRFTVAAVDASVTADGPTYEVSASESGTTLDAATVRAALADATHSTDPADVRLDLAPLVVPPTITTDDAEAVAEAARSTVAALALEIPGAVEDEEPLTFSPETIASWLSFGPDYGVAYALHVDEAAVADAVAGLVESVDQEAVNAQITVAAAGGLGGVIAAKDGRQLDVDATQQALLATLEERGGGAKIGSLALAVNITEPAVTTAAAEAVLPQMQMISSWTTYYVPGEGNGWGNNINIPAFDIDGKNLAPGETFSFWGSVGPFTVRARIHVWRRHHQWAQHPGRRDRRRRLLDVNHHLQRGPAGRPADGNPPQPLLLHRPLSRRARRNRLDHRRLGAGHDLRQRHRQPDRRPRVRRQRVGHLPDLERAAQSERGHHPGRHQQPPASS